MTAMPPSTPRVERLDDLPLLLEHLKQMRIQELIDEYFPTHGNWQGLSLGWTVTIWLMHILFVRRSLPKPCPRLGGGASLHATRTHRDRRFSGLWTLATTGCKPYCATSTKTKTGRDTSKPKGNTSSKSMRYPKRRCGWIPPQPAPTRTQTRKGWYSRE